MSSQSLSDIFYVLKKLIQKRDEIIASLGSDYHHTVLEVWVDYLTAGMTGKARHMCFIAQKKRK